jgi:hypothetical protein
MGFLYNYRYSKNPIFFVIIFLFSVLNIADIVTAFYILPGESNPIFLLTNSIFFVIGIKILLILLAFWIYSKSIFASQFLYFTILTFLILGNFLLLLGVASNVYGILNPTIIQQAESLSVQEKSSYYFQLTFLFYFLPLCLNLLVFKLWEKSINKVKIIKCQKT